MHTMPKKLRYSSLFLVKSLMQININFGSMESITAE